jgi:hypothetical protein
MDSTIMIMTSSPRVFQTTVDTAELCTVAIQNEVLAKLSDAVLPSSAATTATAPGGARQWVGQRVDHPQVVVSKGDDPLGPPYGPLDSGQGRELCDRAGVGLERVG